MIDNAIKQATKSKFKRARIGCVIVSAGRVIATGHNQIRGYKGPKERRWLNSLHAEIDCILNAIRSGAYDSLKNATMFVAHVRPSGTVGNALPCQYCWEVIKSSGKFKKVIYTTEYGDVAEVKV